MKTVVTVENGRVTIQVDDETPIELEASSLAKKNRGAKSHLHGLVASKEHAPSPPPEKPVHVDKAPAVLSAKASATSPARKCEVCGDDISRLNKLSKICQKPECITTKRREYNARWQAKKKPDEPIQPPSPPVPYKNETKSEEEEVQASMNALRDNFDDPWNCLMCRNAGSLCVMHEKMTAEGKKPPRYRA